MQEIKKRFEEQTRKYEDNFHRYGYSEFSLFMPSDRRAVRYYELVKNFEFFQSRTAEPFTICDAGCGFGDMNGYLQAVGFDNYHYIGLDVVDDFLEAGRKKYGSDQVRYIKRNFITDDISDLSFDYAVSSQTFTICYTEEANNYETIHASISKLFRQCRKGVSFNFFTDRGQFQHEGTAYHDPVKLLEFAYTLSADVVLDNSCFPYECTLTVLKDNALSENGMIYDRFLRVHKEAFEKGIFVVNKKEQSL